MIVMRQSFLPKEDWNWIAAVCFQVIQKEAPFLKLILEPCNQVIGHCLSTILPQQSGPGGLTYARNLTSHETCIKGWKEEVFIQSFRTGKHMGLEDGRPTIHPIPWFNPAGAEEEDLKAIYHYLQSLKPVDNYVPEPVSPEEVLKMVENSKKQKM